MATKECNIPASGRLIIANPKERNVPPRAWLLSIKNFIQMTADGSL